MALYTSDIDRILRRNPRTARIYKGCFPSDKIPKFTAFPSAVVANFDDSDEPGTHWAAFYARSPIHVYYFDSLGLGIQHDPEIEEYVWDNFATSTQQHLSLQAKTSSVCGHYAIFFVYACCLNIPFVQITALIKRQKNRDRFVYNFVNNVIRK